MYGRYWDAYYRRHDGSEPGRVALWDVPADRAAALDHAHFKSVFDPALPVVDLGCGTGAQAAWLRGYYDRVVGVDVSAVAVEEAGQKHRMPGLEFAELDVTRPGQAEKLAERIGPANVYMRGVLHQLLPDHLNGFRRSLALMLGSDGCCFFNEVSAGVRDYFERSPDRFSQLPERMRRVFISNLPPRGLDVEEVSHFFPGGEFELKAVGRGHLETNLTFADGTRIAIPSVHGLVAIR